MPLCTAVDSQTEPAIIPDGAGGAIVTWEDSRTRNSDIHAQRVNSAGVPQWTADGVAVCTAIYQQYFPTLVSDGSGGAIITWFDFRNLYSIYAQRVSAAGFPEWTTDGVALCSGFSIRYGPVIRFGRRGGCHRRLGRRARRQLPR